MPISRIVCLHCGETAMVDYARKRTEGFCSDECRTAREKQQNQLLAKERAIERNERAVQWRLDHLEQYRAYQRERARAKRATDPRFQLDHNMSCAIGAALLSRKGGRSWELLVGYNLDELIDHLEAKFESGMSWNNYGSHWHVDHIVPKSWFAYDSTDDASFRACWALQNLQPLTATDNLRKGNRKSG